MLSSQMNLLLRGCHVIAIGGALFLSSARNASACACCADPGYYVIETGKPIGSYRLDLVRGMKFGSTAQLYLTDAGEDEVKGVASISQSNALAATLEPKQWRLTFRAENGKSGVLTLPLPSKMTAFAADINEEGTSGGGGPVLYKEWRFEGSATGDGIFQAGFTSPARYTLIFQGRGNKCDNGEDFTHWRLEISGKKAAYSFFGELVADTP
jgi:hypothetical protein